MSLIKCFFEHNSDCVLLDIYYHGVLSPSDFYLFQRGKEQVVRALDKSGLFANRYMKTHEVIAKAEKAMKEVFPKKCKFRVSIIDRDECGDGIENDKRIAEGQTLEEAWSVDHQALKNLSDILSRR